MKATIRETEDVRIYLTTNDCGLTMSHILKTIEAEGKPSTPESTTSKLYSSIMTKPSIIDVSDKILSTNATDMEIVTLILDYSHGSFTENHIKGFLEYFPEIKNIMIKRTFSYNPEKRGHVIIITLTLCTLESIVRMYHRVSREGYALVEMDLIMEMLHEISKECNCALHHHIDSLANYTALGLETKKKLSYVEEGDGYSVTYNPNKVSFIESDEMLALTPTSFQRAYLSSTNNITRYDRLLFSINSNLINTVTFILNIPNVNLKNIDSLHEKCICLRLIEHGDYTLTICSMTIYEFDLFIASLHKNTDVYTMNMLRPLVDYINDLYAGNTGGFRKTINMD